MAATFGKRTIQTAMPRSTARAAIAAAPVAAALVTAAPVAAATGVPSGIELPTIRFPLVTIGLLVLLTLVFLWEVHASAHRGFSPGVGALIGYGAVDRALVLSGGWWRILTAPLLHANLGHLISNGVVLGVIGFMLEPLIGPRWFAAMYAVGAIGGSLCSIALNEADIPSVGASGAIMGVLAGAFFCGASAKAGPKGRKMQTWALRLMLPALIPLAADSHVDYAGHLGGVVAGLAMGVLLQMAWPRGADRPELGAAAATVGGVVLAGGLFALLLIPHGAATAAVVASSPSTLMPEEDVPDVSAVNSDRARELLARYPHDPRAHLLRGFAFLRYDHDLADAEEQFRQALAAKDVAGLDPDFAKTVTVFLALSVAYEHRPDEARALGTPLCGFAARHLSQISDTLREQGICA
ncbi:MAG: rhomboid family intramembrane serine protease [Rhizomicrobium sp.]